MPSEANHADFKKDKKTQNKSNKQTNKQKKINKTK